MLVLAQEEWMNIVLGNRLDYPRGHWKARYRHHLVGLREKAPAIPSCVPLPLCPAVRASACCEEAEPTVVNLRGGGGGSPECTPCNQTENKTHSVGRRLQTDRLGGAAGEREEDDTTMRAQDECDSDDDESSECETDAYHRYFLEHGLEDASSSDVSSSKEFSNRDPGLVDLNNHPGHQQAPSRRRPAKSARTGQVEPNLSSTEVATVAVLLGLSSLAGITPSAVVGIGLYLVNLAYAKTGPKAAEDILVILCVYRFLIHHEYRTQVHFTPLRVVQAWLSALIKKAV